MQLEQLPSPCMAVITATMLSATGVFAAISPAEANAARKQKLRPVIPFGDTTFVTIAVPWYPYLGAFARHVAVVDPCPASPSRINLPPAFA